MPQQPTNPLDALKKAQSIGPATDNIVARLGAQQAQKAQAPPSNTPLPFGIERGSPVDTAAQAIGDTGRAISNIGPNAIGGLKDIGNWATHAPKPPNPYLMFPPDQLDYVPKAPGQPPASNSAAPTMGQAPPPADTSSNFDPSSMMKGLQTAAPELPSHMSMTDANGYPNQKDPNGPAIMKNMATSMTGPNGPALIQQDQQSRLDEMKRNLANSYSNLGGTDRFGQPTGSAMVSGATPFDVHDLESTINNSAESQGINELKALHGADVQAQSEGYMPQGATSPSQVKGQAERSSATMKTMAPIYGELAKQKLANEPHQQELGLFSKLIGGGNNGNGIGEGDTISFGNGLTYHRGGDPNKDALNQKLIQDILDAKKAVNGQGFLNFGSGNQKQLNDSINAAHLQFHVSDPDVKSLVEQLGNKDPQAVRNTLVQGGANRDQLRDYDNLLLLRALGQP